MARTTVRLIALALLAAAVSSPPAQADLALPGTTGAVHLHSHVHLYRLLPVPATRVLPDAAAAGEFARAHDQISGEWASGSTSVPDAGLLRYPDGAPAEPDMLVANPGLSLILYLNATGIEHAFFPPFFPAAWYASSGPNEFDTYDANPTTTAPFASSTYGITAAGWRDWVGKYSHWLLAHAPAGAYDGVYLDGMHLPQHTVADTDGIADLWGAANPGKMVVTNSLLDGTTYYGGARGTLGHGDVANIEFWLNQPAPAGAKFPSVARWETDVSAAIDAQARGSAVQTMTKLYDNRLSEPTVRQWRELTVASYLIANRGHLLMELSTFGGINDWGWPKQTVAWQKAWRYWQEGAEHFRVYGAKVGASIDTAADAAAGANQTKTAVRAYLRDGIYQRRFASGLAAVNPKATAVTLQLDGRRYYYARNGKQVTSRSISVAAHSGVVLTLVPTTPPSD